MLDGSSLATRRLLRWTAGLCFCSLAAIGCGPTTGGGGNSASLSGTVVVANVSSGTVTPTSTAVSGASVWIELQNSSNSPFQNLFAFLTTDNKGKFQSGSLPKGTYQIVVDAQAMPNSDFPSDPTIAVNATNGSNSLMIPLVAATVNAAIAQGQVTSVNPSSAPISIGVIFGGLENFTFPGGSSGLALIPFFPSNTIPVMNGLGETTTGQSPGTNCISPAGCGSSAVCACYQLALPASLPVVGTANNDGSNYTPPASSAPLYSVDELASTTNFSSRNCNPSEVQSNSFPGSGNIPSCVVSGLPCVQPVNFSGCT